MALITLIGCGDSNKQQTMDELGISSEEYDEISAAVNGNSTSSEKTDNTPEGTSVAVYEMKEEMKTNDPSIFKFQIDDEIVSISLGMTTEDVFNILKDYTIKEQDTRRELDLNESVTEKYLVVYSKKQSEEESIDTEVLVISVGAITDEAIPLKDCYVTSIKPNSYYIGSIYMAPGLPISDSAITNGDMLTENIEDYFESIGITEFPEDAGDYLVNGTTLMNYAGESKYKYEETAIFSYTVYIYSSAITVDSYTLYSSIEIPYTFSSDKPLNVDIVTSFGYIKG